MYENKQGGRADGRVDALVLDGKDNVATVLREIAAGEQLLIRTPAGEIRLAAREAIPLCHKITLGALEAGEAVVKYGEPIGRTRAPVAAGALLHVHNMASDRARRPG
jgi:altronate dehydratase small subunit